VTRLFGLELVPASVGVGASFRDAVDVIAAEPVSAVAVVDGDGRVVGVVGSDALLEGLFPRYLAELRHTAFVKDDHMLLEQRAREAGSEPVAKHMAPPVVVEHDSSATHVAELFLHHDRDALPVVEHGRFVGMLGRAEFCRAMIVGAVGEEAPRS
jgi:CBS domain-containing protein